MGESNIEWTQHTWNPLVGCSVVSPGCTNCYAMKMAARIEAMKSSHYDGTTKRVNGNAVWTGKLAMAPDNILLAPLRRKKPTTYFVNSMGDLFHEGAHDYDIDMVMAVIALSPQHTFQVLTKRAERMRSYMTDAGRPFAISNAINTITKMAFRTNPWPLPNLWLGVSAERQQEADERIPLLLQTPAAVRFVSAEPLLGPIDFTRLHTDRWMTPGEMWLDAFSCRANGKPQLNWIIVGGESGPDARPMNPQWARDIVAQCDAAGVKVFFKQWGAWAPQFDECGGQHPAVKPNTPVHVFKRTEHIGTSMVRVGKKAAGRLLDGIEHSAMPKVTA